MSGKIQVEYWQVDRLKPYERNPRDNDGAVERMADAIREFGFRVPIVILSDGSLVDGHLRLKAAKRLGLSEVPVVLADDLTETQIKAFRLLVNTSATWAKWDKKRLSAELGELSLADFNLDLTGFAMPDLSRVLGESHNIGLGGCRRRDEANEKRCNLTPCPRIYRLAAMDGGYIACFTVTDDGVPLSQLKAADYVRTFAQAAVDNLRKVVSGFRDFCVTCPPPRRHPEGNFAEAVAKRVADSLGIPFSRIYAPNDESKQRLRPNIGLYHPEGLTQNVILYDDVLTTGKTLSACHELLGGHNVVSCIGINNK